MGRADYFSEQYTYNRTITTITPCAIHRVEWRDRTQNALTKEKKTIFPILLYPDKAKVQNISLQSWYDDSTFIFHTCMEKKYSYNFYLKQKKIITGLNFVIHCTLFSVLYTTYQCCLEDLLSLFLECIIYLTATNMTTHFSANLVPPLYLFATLTNCL